MEAVPEEKYANIYPDATFPKASSLAFSNVALLGCLLGLGCLPAADLKSSCLAWPPSIAAGLTGALALRSCKAFLACS